MNEVWAVYGVYYNDNGNECHDIMSYYSNRNSAVTQAEKLDEEYSGFGNYFGFDVKPITVKD